MVLDPYRDGFQRSSIGLYWTVLLATNNTARGNAIEFHADWSVSDAFQTVGVNSKPERGWVVPQSTKSDEREACSCLVDLWPRHVRPTQLPKERGPSGHSPGGDRASGEEQVENMASSEFQVGEMNMRR